MRLKILSGIEGRDYEVDVRVPNRTLTEQEFKEYNIRANKNTGEFDFDILSSSFEYEDLQDWGFSDDELTDFTLDLIDDDDSGDDVVPDKPVEARSQLGDLYELGSHRVLCGDSTDKEIVAVLMNSDKADMVFTDPPYGVNYSHADRPKPSKTNLGKIMNDNIDLTRFLPKIFSNLYLAAADNCSFYIWHADKTAHIFYGCIEGSDLEFNQMLIWKKPMLLGRAKSNDKGIQKLLLTNNIKYYSFIELGNIFIDYEDWEVRYKELLETTGDFLTKGLSEVPQPFCLLCAEKKAPECHRKIISDYLQEQGWKIEHLE
jgi:hypothetical protein